MKGFADKGFADKGSDLLMKLGMAYSQSSMRNETDGSIISINGDHLLHNLNSTGLLASQDYAAQGYSQAEVTFITGLQDLVVKTAAPLLAQMLYNYMAPYAESLFNAAVETAGRSLRGATPTASEMAVSEVKTDYDYLDGVARLLEQYNIQSFPLTGVGQDSISATFSTAFDTDYNGRLIFNLPTDVNGDPIGFANPGGLFQYDVANDIYYINGGSNPSFGVADGVPTLTVTVGGQPKTLTFTYDNLNNQFIVAQVQQQTASPTLGSSAPTTHSPSSQSPTTAAPTSKLPTASPTGSPTDLITSQPSFTPTTKAPTPLPIQSPTDSPVKAPTSSQAPTSKSPTSTSSPTSKSPTSSKSPSLSPNPLTNPPTLADLQCLLQNNGDNGVKLTAAYAGDGVAGEVVFTKDILSQFKDLMDGKIQGMEWNGMQVGKQADGSILINNQNASYVIAKDPDNKDQMKITQTVASGQYAGQKCDYTVPVPPSTGGGIPDWGWALIGVGIVTVGTLVARYTCCKPKPAEVIRDSDSQQGTELVPMPREEQELGAANQPSDRFEFRQGSGGHITMTAGDGLESSLNPSAKAGPNLHSTSSAPLDTRQHGASLSSE